ncbi:MAG: hypothetical protein WC087_02800 [Candidatus Paceibacterota bacterium]
MKKIIAIIVLLIIGAGFYYWVEMNQISENEIYEMPYEQEQKQDNVVPSQSVGKINIDEVCANALIRMTFTDGESAAKFVQECREGKHPEVIEQFKAEMNLGAGAEI